MEEKDSHLPAEHGDVVEVSLTSLFDRQSAEEAAPVFGEQRLLSLQRQTEVTYFMHQWLLLYSPSIMQHTVYCSEDKTFIVGRSQLLLVNTALRNVLYAGLPVVGAMCPKTPHVSEKREEIMVKHDVYTFKIRGLYFL